VNRATTRSLLGLAAGSCLLAGGLIFWQGQEANSSILLRAGMVLAAVWVAWPALARVDRRWLGPALAGLILAVVRPGLLLWALPAWLVLGGWRRRSSPSPRRDR
jgi:hypothetical protein